MVRRAGIGELDLPSQGPAVVYWKWQAGLELIERANPRGRASSKENGMENPQQAGKVVLITGSSSGIGLHAAVSAAQAGHRVIATMRTPSKADRLLSEAAKHGVTVEPWPLDVTDSEAIVDTVQRIHQEFGRLDVLINNAGAAQVGTVETLTDADLRQAMNVNYFGVMALTRAALPLLREVGGRVITVSSVGGVVGQPFNDAYCAAKFAVEGAMESLAPVAAALGVSVVVVEPAAVASEFIANAGMDSEHMVADAGPYGQVLQAYLARSARSFSAAQDATEVGELLARLITDADPPFRVQTSPGATAFIARKLADLDGAAVQTMTRTWLS